MLYKQGGENCFQCRKSAVNRWLRIKFPIGINIYNPQPSAPVNRLTASYKQVEESPSCPARPGTILYSVQYGGLYIE